jgi:hypothetical protein
MSTIPFLLFAWVIHVIVAAAAVTPVVVLARKRVHWRSWELLSLVIPFCVWMAFMYSDMSTGSKSLSNLIVEPGILALVLAVGALARIAMTATVAERKASAVVLVGLCFAAAGIFWIVPVLPE